MTGLHNHVEPCWLTIGNFHVANGLRLVAFGLEGQVVGAAFQISVIVAHAGIGLNPRVVFVVSGNGYGCRKRLPCGVCK